MLAGVSEDMIICTQCDLALSCELHGADSQWWLTLDYAKQPEPKGLAQAFILANETLDGYGSNGRPRNAAEHETRSTVFGCFVRVPQRFDLVEFREGGEAISIEANPVRPRSHFAVTEL